MEVSSICMGSGGSVAAVAEMLAWGMEGKSVSMGTSGVEAEQPVSRMDKIRKYRICRMVSPQVHYTPE
jgi:hypothetical protein